MEQHEKSRSCLCLICGSSANRVLTPRLESVVANFLISDYSVENLRLPKAACTSCVVVLNDFAKNDFSRSLPDFVDYSGMVSFRPPRGTKECQCMLCIKAPFRGKFGKKRFSGKFGQRKTTKRKHGRPSNDENANVKFSKLCPKCLSPIGRGLNHNCSKSTLVSNVSSFSTPTKTRILEEILGPELEESGTATVSTKSKPWTWYEAGKNMVNFWTKYACEGLRTVLYNIYRTFAILLWQ